MNRRDHEERKGERTVLDAAGRCVTLPRKVQGVCAAGVSLNQLLLTLGASGRMVGTLPQMRDNPWFRRMVPRAQSLPSTAGSVEELGRLAPDLVVTWNDDEAAERLRGRGIPVLVVRFSTPREFRGAVMTLATALGEDAPERALRFCRSYDALRALVAEGLSDLPMDDRTSVYYCADGPLSTEGCASIVSSWIAEAGGINVAARAGIAGSRSAVTSERLLEWNPEVIVVRDEADRERFLAQPRWQGLKAVRTGRVHAVPRGVVAWSTRNGESLLQPLWAAKTLHPRRFAGIALEPLVVDFFRDFYGTGIEASEVAAVLSGHAPETEGR